MIAVMASEIETAAFAVLTYINRRDLSSAFPVVKWLSQHRNSHGGFFSTQVQFLKPNKNIHPILIRFLTSFLSSFG